MSLSDELSGDVHDDDSLERPDIVDDEEDGPDLFDTDDRKTDPRIQRLFDPRAAQVAFVPDGPDEEVVFDTARGQEQERRRDRRALWACRGWHDYIHSLKARRAQLVSTLSAQEPESIGRFKEIELILETIESDRRL